MDISGVIDGCKTLIFLIHGYKGLDHGAGHSLLLLCDAKTPPDKKSKEFKALGHYLCNVSIGLLEIITKYIIYITV